MNGASHVLLVGSGGREHALAWKLAQSPAVAAVYVAPGNAGTVNSGKISNVDVNINDHKAVIEFCKEHDVQLAVIGPEDPLAAGIADVLNGAGIPCFGPSAAAAQIEASKEFAKAFMTRHHIPTARWKSFTDSTKACSYINSADHAALVVKASGLAAGKGVIVAPDRAAACAAVHDMLDGNKMGAAGHTVVVEELLTGQEVSVLAFCDGETVAVMPPAQDHKRLLDGDQGPNTGGMGAYCPCPLVSSSDLDFIKKEVLQKAVDGMKKENMPYVGVLYAGLMLTPDGPRVLEYNCRFGDPETQVLLPLLESDLYDVMHQCVKGTLCGVKFSSDRVAVGVVAVSDGYPGSYKKGLPITGLESVECELKQTIFHAGTKMANSQVVTSGGRVLAVVAIDSSLATAAWCAQQGVAKVSFEGKFYRKDIAAHALGKTVCLTYNSSGVDIGAGDALVDSIKPFARATARAGCSADLGGFGGVFDLKAAGYSDPLLVSGTDGVGTKIKIAQACKLHGTVGIDLVAMCVNDTLCHGAEPLFFLDYFACGKLDVGVAKSVVEGVAKGCKMAGCALLGGETAEMPGLYNPGEYDLAGFTVGAVNRPDYLPCLSAITTGDVMIGLPSAGLHSNGFSLVRKVVEVARCTFGMTCPWDDTKNLGAALLEPTRIYVHSVLEALKSHKVKAACHITGGGLPGNVVRVLPDGMSATLYASKWNVLPVFGWIADKGNVEAAEMARTFNCGVGMVLVTSAECQEEVLHILRSAGEDGAAVIGKLNTHTGGERVVVEGLGDQLVQSYRGTSKHTPPDKRARTNGHVPVVVKKKVAVLISGSGTNLQALIDATQHPDSSSQITLVISNKPRVKGLTRAQTAGIPTQVISHKDYKDRAAFDSAMHNTLVTAGVEIVCLAGFMRILTGEFVRKWAGRMLNIHPSLLPSFKGANAQKMALAAHVCISGCTVHFVAEEVDGGAILVQEAVPVLPGDTEETLSSRIREREHMAFPRAMELVASGRATLGEDNVVVWK